MKRNFLLDIENHISSRWDKDSREYHQSHVDLDKPKFFATFPYPYMNGKLHLGHAFTMCKVDFTSRFKRLTGHNVLFPFGFHCTGMPICAAAKKLSNELETIIDIQTNPDSKLQYNILKYYKLSHDEIVKFVDPLMWVKYFSQEGFNDIRSFNLMVDLDRSFVTTDLNPFYDSFISYQFEKLHQLGLLKYGTRNSIYSPNLDIQCQDHDRSVGEGVGIVEYVLQSIISSKQGLQDIPDTQFLFVIKKSYLDSKENATHNYTILLNQNSKFVKFVKDNETYYCSEYIYQNIAHQDLMNLGELSNYVSISEQINPELLLDKFEQIKLVGSSISLSENIKNICFSSNEMFGLVGFAVKGNLSNNMEYNFKNNIFTSKLFYLPDDVVIDRSGKYCVIKPLPQWYINYADKEWKEKTIRLVRERMCSNSEITKILISNITKLHEWGVSRQFGLGTRLPCDSNELIDSLSDSTVYPAYYTISNFIQSNIFGKGLNNVKASDFTFMVWEYIFSNTDKEPELGHCSSINLNLINKMRESFNYWYPVDLRISGKDLLSNHLIMYLFNHSVCFKEKYFPKTIFANGWILIDGIKMSKSNGNFVTIGELIGNVPIDSIRMTLADSGDDFNDANYVCSNATDNNLLKIYDWIKHMEELNTPNEITKYRTNTLEMIDELFKKLIDKQIKLVIKHYNDLRFRDVLIEGFFNFNGLREKYKIYCKVLDLEPHQDLIQMFCISQTILINPIIPHSTEYIWEKVLNSSDLIYNSEFIFTLTKKWTDDAQNYDLKQPDMLIEDWENIMELNKQIQSALVRNSKKKNWTCKKIIFKFNLKKIDPDFVKNLFSKVFGYSVELSDLDRPKPYFIMN